MRTKVSGESALLLLDVIAVLRRHSIDYAVIGAMAAAVHGVIRASQDADIVVSLAVRDVRQVQRAFLEAGFSVQLRRGDSDDPIQAVLELEDGFENRVDVLVGIKGLGKGTFDRAVEVTFSGESLRVVSREDFIAMKLYAGGPQDLSDAKQVLAISAGLLDLSSLRMITTKYGRVAVANLDAILR